MSFPVDDIERFVEEELDYDELGIKVDYVENSGDSLEIGIDVVRPRKEDVIMNGTDDTFRALETAKRVSDRFGYDAEVVMGAGTNYTLTLYPGE